MSILIYFVLVLCVLFYRPDFVNVREQENE